MPNHTTMLVNRAIPDIIKMKHLDRNAKHVYPVNGTIKTAWRMNPNVSIAPKVLTLPRKLQERNATHVLLEKWMTRLDQAVVTIVRSVTRIPKPLQDQLIAYRAKWVLYLNQAVLNAPDVKLVRLVMLLVKHVNVVTLAFTVQVVWILPHADNAQRDFLKVYLLKHHACRVYPVNTKTIQVNRIAKNVILVNTEQT
jgi:hypothetical protein